jgi:Carboxypeptidase regulatory-like domain/TonB-dependent Receptor Plug Domain
MRREFRFILLVLLILGSCWVCAPVRAQVGSAGTIEGTVKDPSGAAVAGAPVEIANPVSGYRRDVTTGEDGSFTFSNVPFNPYHLVVKAAGFAAYIRDVEVRSGVPVAVAISLKLATASATVTVEATGGDLVENDSTSHTDVDRGLFDKLPLESVSSSVSSLVTLAAPGIAADSNGLFHGFGDHASNSFSVDGQPITDQQSKVFSNQIPLGAIQSLEVIQGAPPAEYGDKTSLVINVTTRSGLGVTTPHGSVHTSYGSFGTADAGFDVLYGGQKWGNYLSVDGLNSGRFLDGPELSVFHDRGNEENVFDRADFQLTQKDTIHVNLGYTRSWFQNPNSFDSQNSTAWYGTTRGNIVMAVSDGGIGPNGLPVGPADQRSQIQTFNIAPSWTRVISSTTVLTLGGFARRDAYNYYPSANPFSDLGPPSLQQESVSQYRTLLNAGLHASVSYVKGIHNVKAGITYMQTLLTENDKLGIVNPLLNAPCITANPNPATNSFIPFVPVQGLTDPSQCAAGSFQQNVDSNPNAPASSMNPNPANAALYPLFNPVLLPFDLTRGGGLFAFNGHTDVKELALYVQDTISTGNWNFNLGIRGDLYNGLTISRQPEPRLGVAYDIKPSNTVLRLSYARTLETPFNENLVLSSTGCFSAVIASLVSCVPAGLPPGFRNEFHAGLQQAFGRYLVVDGEYIWKYTRNAFDFSIFGNTPIFFPIDWHNSKISGYAVRVSVPENHGFTAVVNFSGIAARFFTPQVGGLGTIPAVAGGGFAPFRIDHDEAFNQTTHLQYQPWKRGPWLGFNWRFDSGLVAGASPCYGVLSFNSCPGSVLLGGVQNVSTIVANAGGVPMSADQEFQAGFTCNGVRATPTTPLPFNCPASQFGSTLIKVPGINAENDDKNPPRIAARNLFDLAVGDDNLFRGDKYQWSLRFTVINLANKTALYNFLSTFSGTHYVTPRAETIELGFHF